MHLTCCKLDTLILAFCLATVVSIALRYKVFIKSINFGLQSAVNKAATATTVSTPLHVGCLFLYGCL